MKSANKRWYATKRITRAVDRQLTASTPEEKDQAVKWINAWAAAARPGLTSY